MPTIQKERCTGCGTCTEICPNFVFVVRRQNGGFRIIVENEDLCCRCGHCLLYCPQNAIHHEAIAEGSIHPVQPVLPGRNPIERTLLHRRSIRSYTPEKVSGSRIRRLLRTAAHAGTASNLHSEQALVIQDTGLLAMLESVAINTLWNKGLKYATSRSIVGRLLSKRLPGPLYANATRYRKIIERRRNANCLGGMIFRKAPCVIVLHGYRRDRLSPANCAIAIRNIELMAFELGLGACWAGLFITAAGMNHRRFNRLLQIRASRQIFGAVMIGKPKYLPLRFIERTALKQNIL